MTAIEIPGSEQAVRPSMTFDEIWAAHYAELAGWVAGIAGDRELGHELAAESFIRLYARWRRVDNPRAFLYVVATNLLKDWWRRERRRRRATARLEADRDAGAQPAPDTSVRDLVDRLPDRYRVIVLLHYYADLTVADVARATGRAEGTVKRELAEARSALHEALEGHR